MKISRKFLKELIAREGPLMYDEIVSKLEADQVDYTNDYVLQGLLHDCVDKGILVDEGGKMQLPIRGSTGGQPPTKMYRLDSDGVIEEEDIDDLILQADDRWQTTPLAAIKSAKTRYYNDEYKSKIEWFKQLEAQFRA